MTSGSSLLTYGNLEFSIVKSDFQPEIEIYTLTICKSSGCKTEVFFILCVAQITQLSIVNTTLYNNVPSGIIHLGYKLVYFTQFIYLYDPKKLLNTNRKLVKCKVHKGFVICKNT